MDTADPATGRAGAPATPPQAPLTNPAAYDARDEDGEIHWAIGPRDWNRFKQTLRFVPEDTRSLLDCGCDRGHWLHFVLQNRRLDSHLGIDISSERIREAQARYPELKVQAGYLENLAMPPQAFDVVTCLECLEHIPRWPDVFERLLEFARQRVVITVPYREEIAKTACIHCGKITPLYGHLHVFSEESFPARPGFRQAFGFIKDYGIGRQSVLRRVFRRLRPTRAWLVAVYDREGAD